MSLEIKEKEPIMYILEKNRTNEIWEKEKENNITYAQLTISC
jgi:hypothetical protein